MLDEIALDVSKGTLYISDRLSAVGRVAYPRLLREAAESHDIAWLASQLRDGRHMNATEQRRKPKGGYTTAAVPVTAPDTLAEGEFNRFYARAICLRAIENKETEVVVFRAKQVSQPRAESVALVGKRLNAQVLLNDLRTHQGMDTAIRLPPGPNSGLSVRLAAN